VAIDQQPDLHKHHVPSDPFAAIDTVLSGERSVSSSLNFAEGYLNSL
jgi:hypothetical protein